MAKLFTDYDLLPEIQQALAKMGMTSPTEIQEKSLSVLMEGKVTDIHGQAQTGTGKTLAFGLPIIQNIDPKKAFTQALIVAPTRELVVQICDSLRAVAQYRNISVEPIYGGVSIYNQIHAVKRGAHIVVGTPGRLNDPLNRKTLSLNGLNILVLDEADIMLDMGFKEEVDEILRHAPKNRQIWLFSATIKPGIMDIKRDHMKDVVTIKAAGDTQGATGANIKQYFCIAPSRNRLQALCRFIDNAPEFYGLIFCQTKILASEVADRLTRRGYTANALHGDMSQLLRNNVISQFKSRRFNILVATDVAARGIDINDLSHVINYSLPEDQESYVHRIGRTGRAGKLGTAITFIMRSDVRRLKYLVSKFASVIDPIEVPSIEHVMKARVDKALAYLHEISARETETREHHIKGADILRAAVAGCTQEELVDGLVSILSDQFLKGYGSDNDVSFESSAALNDYESNTYSNGGGNSGQYNDGSPDGATKEVILNVGSDDGLTKQDIMEYCFTIQGVAREGLEKIRVIRRRSFIVVPTAQATMLARGLQGKELGGRKVRAIIGDVMAAERGGSRGGNGGGEGRRSSSGPRKRYGR
jgi:ATP-dependent RNA helicase DeaD